MKILINTAIILAAALSFCGCGVSKLYTHYERSGVEFVDSLYRRLPAHHQDSSSVASLSWTEFFSDTTLQGWIRLGLEHNSDLATARLRVDQAQASLQAARQAFLPGASLSASAGTGYPGTYSYGISPTVSWEADIFGKLANAKRQAAAALEQSEAYRQAVESQLVATIAESYYRLLMLDSQLAISQRTLDTWEENIKTLEALKRAGKTNEAAVLQAKANRLDVENSTYNLHLQIFEAENAFAALIGTVPFKIDRGRLEDQSFPHHLSGGIPAEILSNRPDVRQAEMDLAQAFYATNIARAAFYPNIKLTGNMAFNPAGFVADLTASLLQPLYAKGANKAALRKAEAAQKIATYEFRQSLLDAGVEVNNALVALQTASARMKVDQKQIVTLQAAVWNTQMLMKHGNANYLEVLSAQQKLLQAELAEVSDHFEEIRNAINLYHALGGGYAE
jgi:NodT family efflux transporter outer membrane factor (OMF) lipoprotein